MFEHLSPKKVLRSQNLLHSSFWEQLNSAQISDAIHIHQVQQAMDIWFDIHLELRTYLTYMHTYIHAQAFTYRSVKKLHLRDKFTYYIARKSNVSLDHNKCGQI